MRTIKENFEDKARLASDISVFIDALEYPLENEDDADATLCVTIQESGVRTTRLYSEQAARLSSPPMFSDGTIHENGKLLLDKATKECLVDALKERLGQLKKELKDLLN